MEQPIVDISKLLKITDDFYTFQQEDALLGAGAFGEVYKGYCKSRNKIIAVKHITKSEDYEREVQTLKILSTLIHPHIMGFYGFKQINDDVYMFMELCPNGDLTASIKKGLTELQALVYFRQMVEGMCYMNAKGKMHRDLKPDNILIGIEKDVKISDFGLARQTENIMISGKKGTPIYAGPEVYLEEDDGYTERCDVWGGGLVLYEMLTGEMLFKHVKTYPQLKEEWIQYQKGAKRVKYHEKMHPLWEYFTNIMLTFDPKKRPTYHEILEILKKTYDKMYKEIESKTISKSSNPKLSKVENYLNFESQKYGLLINIAERFTQVKFNVKNSKNYTVVFLCLCKYLTHMKKLIRDLKHQNISLPNDEAELIEDEKADFEVVLAMDKFRNSFETSYTYYSDQIRSKIVENLINKYAEREEEKPFFAEIKETFELVTDVRDGLFDVEDTYSEKLLEFVRSKHMFLEEPKLSKMSDEALQLYIWILVASTLDGHFVADNYLKENYVRNRLAELSEGNRAKLEGEIKALKKMIKG